MRNMRLAGAIDKQKCFSSVGYMLLNHLLLTYYIQCNVMNVIALYDTNSRPSYVLADLLVYGI